MPQQGGPDRIFSDTRRINDLSVALRSDDGRKVLEERRDLDDAFEVAGGRLAYVLKGLAKAMTGLQQAAPDYPEYATEDEVLNAMEAIKSELARLTEGGVTTERAADDDEDYELDDDDESDYLDVEDDVDEDG